MDDDPIRRIVLIGACSMDIILSVPHYPSEDEKLRATSFARRRGGNTFNTAEIISGLIAANSFPRDVEIVMIAVLPKRDSPATKEVAESLPGNVNLDYCIYREETTEPITSYIIKSAARDSRTIVTRNELQEMTFEEFEEAFHRLNAKSQKRVGHEEDTSYVPREGPKPTLYHFEGRTPDVIRRCMRLLQQRQEDGDELKISLEVEKPKRAGLRELTSMADIVFYSRSWATGEGYASASDCLRRQTGAIKTPKMLICTWGELGSSALWNYGHGEVVERDIVNVPSKAQPCIVDPVGAGDTFIGAMFYSIARDGWFNQRSADTMENVGKRLAFANEVAAKKLAVEGFNIDFA